MRMRSGVFPFQGWFGGVAVLLALGAGARVEAGDDAKLRVFVSGTVVDEAGKPVAGVRVSAKAWEPVEAVTSGADGAFRLSLPILQGRVVAATFLAKPGDGRLGMKSFRSEPSKLEPVTITVKPGRPLDVRVEDDAGRPVSGADVHVLADFYQVDSGRTGEGGRWTTRVPADFMTNWRVYALKSKVGFDYAQAERARGSAEPPRVLPEQLTLTLDGARPPLRVKTATRDGKPLAGIEVGPWLLMKPGQDGQMNGMQDAFLKTDAAGVALFDWLPTRQVGSFSFVSRSREYYPLDHALWVAADKPVDEVTFTLLPLEELSGKVTAADGRPAAGAKVRLEGCGAGQNSYRGETVTDAGGRYSLKVYSEQAYIITASMADSVAPYKSGVIVRAGKPTAGVDLTLGPGTRVKGRVTLGKEGKSVPQVGMSALIEKGSIPAELRREGDPYYRGMSLSFWATSDAEGRYEFLLGPGEYRLQGPQRVEPVKLTIPADGSPREIVRDFVMPRPERGPLAVTVVDEAGRPVANAALEGAYQAPNAYFSRVLTDARGTVRLDRSLDPLVLVARTPDGDRAGVARIDIDAAEAKVVVKPTATAEGRLTDPQGMPIAGRELSHAIRVHTSADRNSPFGYFFGGTTTTAADGGIRLTGLLVGETYEIYTQHKPAFRLSTAATKVNPTAPGLLALGDVPIDLSPPKPYVSPTPAERAGAAFAARSEKTAREKLDYTLVEAKREYTRPLLLFGNPKDKTCVDLFRLLNDASGEEKPENKSPGDLRWEFELATLDVGRGDASALAKDLGVAPAGDPPFLAVLSNDGTPAATYKLRLGSDDKLDSRALASFLLEHKLPTRDAEAMLAEGLARAKAEDKRVFLIMSASWCPPCRLLARFLAANKAELERHYVFVKLDVSRDARARELRDRYEGKGAFNGVPWYVILDAAGKPLVTSNSKEIGAEQSGNGNIGFPSSEIGIDHFLTMLRGTAPRLSDEAVASLRRELEKKP